MKKLCEKVTKKTKKDQKRQEKTKKDKKRQKKENVNQRFFPIKNVI